MPSKNLRGLFANQWQATECALRLKTSGRVDVAVVKVERRIGRLKVREGLCPQLKPGEAVQQEIDDRES